LRNSANGPKRHSTLQSNPWPKGKGVFNTEAGIKTRSGTSKKAKKRETDTEDRKKAATREYLKVFKKGTDPKKGGMVVVVLEWRQPEMETTKNHQSESMINHLGLSRLRKKSRSTKLQGDCVP